MQKIGVCQSFCLLFLGITLFWYCGGIVVALLAEDQRTIYIELEILNNNGIMDIYGV